MQTGEPACGSSSALPSTCSIMPWLPVPTSCGAFACGTMPSCRGRRSSGISPIIPSSGLTCTYRTVDGFAPPAPFTLDELDPAGLLPERPYTRDELGAYLKHDREKCRVTIGAFTDEQASCSCKFPWGDVSFAGLLLDNMRHVQEHAAELNLILGQKIGWSPRWVAQAKN